MRMLYNDNLGLKAIALHNGTVNVLADAQMGRLVSIEFSQMGRIYFKPAMVQNFAYFI